LLKFEGFYSGIPPMNRLGCSKLLGDGAAIASVVARAYNGCVGGGSP